MSLVSPLVDTSVRAGEFDLSDPEFWLKPRAYREGAFHALRQQRELAFFDEWEFLDSPFPKGPGYFALSRHEDVWHVSRNPQLFISGQGSNIGDLPQEMAEFFGSMIAMDDPKHFRLRSIVSKGFTPKEVARIEGYVLDKARELVDDLIERFPDKECDFVTEFAAPLPLQIICEMMGIPKADEAQIFHWTNTILGFGDPDLTTDYVEFLKVAVDIGAYATALAEDRRANPRDDLTTALVAADVDGERLTSAEIASFFILLAVAGNETTRNAISHGVLALSRYPEQRQIWWNDFDTHAQSAVEEIVSWASPVVYMRRTATRDVEVSGVQIKQGDKVTMWYGSANRDEQQFDNPWLFDVTRTPNHHVGFGGGGTHFCLGANLARREIAVVFEELYRRIPDIVVTEEPSMLLSAFIHGIKRLPVSWTPAGPANRSSSAR